LTEPLPDIITASVLLVFVLLLFYNSGAFKYLLNIYAAGFVVSVLVLLGWWLTFNQVGSNVLFSIKFHGIQYIITFLSLEIGSTKVIGYTTLSLATLMFFMTTRDSDVVDFLVALKISFKKVLFFSLVIRNFDLMAQEFNSIKKAQFARGENLRGGFWPIRKIRGVISMSIPFTAAIVRRSVEMGSALEARGFSKAVDTSNFVYNARFRSADLLFISLFLLLVLFVYTHNMLSFLLR
jgi:energy-coupling factor transport system permease protein